MGRRGRRRERIKLLLLLLVFVRCREELVAVRVEETTGRGRGPERGHVGRRAVALLLLGHELLDLFLRVEYLRQYGLALEVDFCLEAGRQRVHLNELSQLLFGARLDARRCRWRCCRRRRRCRWCCRGRTRL